MFLYFVVLIVLLIFVFSNSLFYIISLLFISLFTLIYLTSINYIRVLMFLLIMIIYIGAIIIFIGYICAICPNIKFSYCFFLFPLFFFISFVVLLLIDIVRLRVISSKSDSLLDYLFRYWGLFIFILIVFILFITLLIVTSQYSSPQGPFRSVA